MQSSLLSSKNVIFLHFKKADKYFALRTLCRNAEPLPSSFIKKQWKQNVKTDHYSSPYIEGKERMGGEEKM